MRDTAIRLALVAVLVTACSTGVEPPQAVRSDAPAAATASAAPSETPSPAEQATDAQPTVSCGQTESVPEQSGSHLVGDSEPPVPYNSTPPTSGWHSSSPAEISVRGRADALTEPEQVSVLEAGGAVVSYGKLARADVRRLARLINRDYAGRVALTPYKQLEPGQVALTAWTKVRLCDGVDVQALRRFADTHADQVGDAEH